MRNAKILKWILYLLAAAAVVAILLFAYTARTALVAEEHYQAFLRAHDATLAFIENSEGKWPRSWNDLREARPDTDYNWVAEHLSFDFAADPAVLATQTPETFRAIVPVEPCCSIDGKVQDLINELQKYHPPE